MASADERERSRSTGGLSLGDFAKRVVVTVAIVALAVVAWQLSQVLIIAFAGVLLATILHAIGDPIARRLRLSPGWTLLIVVAVLLLLAALVGWLLGERLSAQMGQLTQRLPQAWEQARMWLDRNGVTRMLTDALQSLTRGGAPARTIAGFATTTVKAVGMGVVIAFLGLFLAANPRLYLRGALLLVPPRERLRTYRAAIAAGRALKGWLLGQFLSMVLIGVLTGVGLWVIHVPLAFSLGVLAGILEFIPFVGPIASAIPAVLIAFAVSPRLAVYTALLYLLIQQVEGNAIQPLVQKWAVALPPALALIAVVIFGLLFGILGVLFAIPLMVVLMALVQKLYVEAWRTKRGGA